MRRERLNGTAGARHNGDARGAAGRAPARRWRARLRHSGGLDAHDVPARLQRRWPAGARPAAESQGDRRPAARQRGRGTGSGLRFSRRRYAHRQEPLFGFSRHDAGAVARAMRGGARAGRRCGNSRSAISPLSWCAKPAGISMRGGTRRRSPQWPLASPASSAWTRRSRRLPQVGGNSEGRVPKFTLP